jgi:hypothetical protein
MSVRLRTNGLEFYSYNLLVRIYYLQRRVSISELKTLFTNVINYKTHGQILNQSRGSASIS